MFLRSVQPSPPRRRSTAQHGGGSYGRREVKRGNDYPEQSSRQAIRGLRRAQGGPGIVLVNGYYEGRRVEF